MVASYREKDLCMIVDTHLCSNPYSTTHTPQIITYLHTHPLPSAWIDTIRDLTGSSVVDETLYSAGDRLYRFLQLYRAYTTCAVSVRRVHACRKDWHMSCCDMRLSATLQSTQTVLDSTRLLRTKNRYKATSLTTAISISISSCNTRRQTTSTFTTTIRQLYHTVGSND